MLPPTLPHRQTEELWFPRPINEAALDALEREEAAHEARLQAIRLAPAPEPIGQCCPNLEDAGIGGTPGHGHGHGSRHSSPRQIRSARRRMGGAGGTSSDADLTGDIVHQFRSRGGGSSGAGGSTPGDGSASAAAEAPSNAARRRRQERGAGRPAVPRTPPPRAARRRSTRSREMEQDSTQDMDVDDDSVSLAEHI